MPGVCYEKRSRVLLPMLPSRRLNMRPLVIAAVIGLAVASHAQIPLPAPYCPSGEKPPSCGFVPSDEHVRRAEVGASKLSYLLFASYVKCVSKAVIQGSQADRSSFDACTSAAMAGALNRLNVLESRPSCENFGPIALSLLTESKALAGKLYCNGTSP